MKININNKNGDLQTALDNAQGGCSARLLSVEQMQSIVKDAEKRLLEMGIAISEQKGARFKYENGYKMPASYKFSPESTQFVFEKGTKCWFVTNISRWYCDHNRQTTFCNEEEFRQFYKFLAK